MKRKKVLKKQKVGGQRKHDGTSLKLTFLDHALELRSRLILSLGFLLLGSVAGYFFEDRILAFLVRPLGQPLYYTSPGGGFSFTLEIAVFFGFVVCLPFLVFQSLRFVEPAIPKRARFSVGFLLGGSLFLMLAGMAFAYFVSLPIALNFLSKFSSDEVKSLISAREYFSFVLTYLLGFGLLFQLPLVLVFVNRTVPLRFSQLMRWQRLVILGAFVVAAVLTPTPDVVNQTIMAIPIILLYQLAILIVWFSNWRSGSS